MRTLPLQDPTTWITETYPWPPSSHAGPQALLSLRPEDVGYDTLAATVSSTTQDKFKNDNQGENDPLVSGIIQSFVPLGGVVVVITLASVSATRSLSRDWILLHSAKLAAHLLLCVLPSK